MEAYGKAVVEWKFLRPSGRGTVWAGVFGAHGEACTSEMWACFYWGEEHGEDPMELLLLLFRTSQTRRSELTVLLEQTTVPKVKTLCRVILTRAENPIKEQICPLPICLGSSHGQSPVGCSWHNGNMACRFSVPSAS